MRPLPQARWKPLQTKKSSTSSFCGLLQKEVMNSKSATSVWKNLSKRTRSVIFHVGITFTLLASIVGSQIKVAPALFAEYQYMRKRRGTFKKWMFCYSLRDLRPGFVILTCVQVIA